MRDTIINSFEIWTDAQGIKSRTRVSSVDNISLEGISRLRELILELAMKGKLMPQDPNDEPASKLLERIEEEKKCLIEKGEIKVSENALKVTEAEKRFDLPLGWEWVKIRDIGHDWGQKTPDKDFCYIDVSAIDNHKGIIISPTILSASYAPSRARKIVKYGTVIYSTIRPYLKNICVIEENYAPEAIASTAFAILHPYLLMPGRFFFLYFRSPMFVKYVEAVQTGIAYPAINDKQFFGAVIPLPPLNEQHRIVTKVDELMAFCDKLEVQQFNNLKTHQVLVKTLLETLTQAADANELQAAWERMSAHFDTLFCTEDSIDQLKQTIRQLAVMGKLVKQDPNDEPASELLGKIIKEKEILVKKGVLKKDVILSDVLDDDKPFSIPKKWIWVRLGNITNKIGSGSTPRGGNNAYAQSGVLFLRSQNIRNEGLLLDDVVFIDDSTNRKMSNTIVKPNDILLNITGGSLGRCTIFPEEAKVANVSQHVTIIRPTIIDSCFYLHACILSPYIQKIIWGRQIGANREGLSKKILEQFEIPYPPLGEQKRIIIKIEELFAICDLLTKKINKAQELKNSLSKTIVEKAVQ